MRTVNIIFEDKNILLVIKPCGVATQDDKTGDLSLNSELSKHYNSEVFTVHRLDRPVSGLMVFAKNQSTAKFLSDNIAKGNFTKKYLCVVNGVAKKEETLKNFLLKNQRLNISKVVPSKCKNSKEAILKYKTVNIKDNLSLLEVELLTGRHHQIRVQLSNIGLPIWGDTKYNEAFSKPTDFVNIALYSYYLEFTNIETKEKKAFKSFPNTFPFSLLLK